MSRFTRAGVVATSALGALALAACSSSGGKQTSDGGGGSGGGADTPDMTVALITHSAPGDTFWDYVRSGAEDAAKKDNVTLEYTSDPDGAKQANLVTQAVDKKVDGIAVTLAKPEAMKQAVQKATKADIPVVALNAGGDAWQDMGVLSYFGQDEIVAGEAAGEKLKEEGRKKVLCVVHEQGHVGLEARCDGVKKTGPTMEKIYVKGTDMPNVQSSITSKLQEDSDIDTVMMLGAPFAMTALKSLEESGSDAELATFDSNKDLIAEVKEGNILFSVDQQPYLQGYLAIDSLWANTQRGLVYGGGEQVLTGPSFVDESNVEEIEKFAEEGTR